MSNSNYLDYEKDNLRSRIANAPDLDSIINENKSRLELYVDIIKGVIERYGHDPKDLKSMLYSDLRLAVDDKFFDNVTSFALKIYEEFHGKVELSQLVFKHYKENPLYDLYKEIFGYLFQIKNKEASDMMAELMVERLFERNSITALELLKKFVDNGPDRIEVHLGKSL